MKGRDSSGTRLQQSRATNNSSKESHKEGTKDNLNKTMEIKPPMLINTNSGDNDLTEIGALSTQQNEKEGHTINATSFQLFSKAKLNMRKRNVRPTTAAVPERSTEKHSRNTNNRKYTTVQ